MGQSQKSEEIGVDNHYKICYNKLHQQNERNDEMIYEPSVFERMRESKQYNAESELGFLEETITETVAVTEDNKRSIVNMTAELKRLTQNDYLNDAKVVLVKFEHAICQATIKGMRVADYIETLKEGKRLFEAMQKNGYCMANYNILMNLQSTVRRVYEPLLEELNDD